MCPLCTISIGAGLGLSRWLKVDDSITGLWIGALLLAFSIFTYNWLAKKMGKKSLFTFLIILIAYWFLSFLPLYASKIINTTCKTIFGLNRLVFGSLVGIIFAGIAILIDKLLRRIKEGKALFPYQKIILPISILIITSFIFNSFCK